MIIIYPKDWIPQAGESAPKVSYYNLPNYFAGGYGDSGWAWLRKESKILAYNSISGGVASGDFDELYNDWMAYNATIYTSDRCSYIVNYGAGLKAFHLGDTSIVIQNNPYSSFVPNVERSGNDEFYTGAGDDHISNINSSDSTLNAGNGNNRISNYSSNRVLIITGSGNDSIRNDYYSGSDLGQYVTIQSGAGDDTVTNFGNNVLIDTGDGKNNIRNTGDEVTIKSAGNHSSIKSGNGKCSIDNGEYSGGIADIGKKIIG